MARNPTTLISRLRRGDGPPTPTPPKRSPAARVWSHAATLVIVSCLSIIVCGAVIRAWTMDALVTMLAAGPLAGVITVTGFQLIGQIRRNAVVTQEQHHCEAQLRQLLHSGITEGLCLLDLDGNIQIWNVTAQHLQGYSGEEVIGRNFRMLFSPDAIAAGEPARLLRIAREHGKQVAEVWLAHKHGSRFLARIEIEAVRDEHGSLYGF